MHRATLHDAPGARTMSGLPRLLRAVPFWLVIAFLLTATVYWPGLSGGWLFDDYPSIVENTAVQPADLGLTSLIDAALSSTTSDFKRPLASLSFALNYRASGLDPYWMKLTNLLIHLLNGGLVFLLARALLRVRDETNAALRGATDSNLALDDQRAGITAVLIAGAWMLLPINLTGVMYVVQRMESMANGFVLLGLIGYVAGRRRMLTAQSLANERSSGNHGFALCAASITIPTLLGLLAKETAVMLPLYAVLIEWSLFGARRPALVAGQTGTRAASADRRIWILFGVVLVLPMVVGMVWMLPRILDPAVWSTRDFTLRTRLLSEARIVLDYIRLTVLPTTHGLKFYYDDFAISKSWLSPWTTAVSMAVLAALIGLIPWLRRRMPLAALGIALFVGAHLLTATIVPLELVFEHRNYFASFGLLLALVPLLAAPDSINSDADVEAVTPSASLARTGTATLPFGFARHALLAALLVLWTAQTALGAYTWGSPLRLALELAARSPESPRAQYALGRTYSVYSNQDATSRFTPLAYAALEKAAKLPGSSILPEQALIYMNALMHIPAKDAWWDSLIAKLHQHAPTVQDESALRALSICAIKQRCDLPKNRMSEAFQAALAYPNPGAQLQARYGDYAWNVMNDKALGVQLIEAAVKANPREVDYQVALIRMLVTQGQTEQANAALRSLESLNAGGQLDGTLRELHALRGLTRD